MYRRDSTRADDSAALNCVGREIRKADSKFSPTVRLFVALRAQNAPRNASLLSLFILDFFVSVLLYIPVIGLDFSQTRARFLTIHSIQTNRSIDRKVNLGERNYFGITP